VAGKGWLRGPASYDEGVDDPRPEDRGPYDDLGDVTPTVGFHSMQGIPSDARAMGLDRNVVEGAWLDFAGSLNASKPSHRIVAWLLLAAIVIPILLTLKAELF
jgi:hypothetical protein